jgi:hypothetical protein
MLLASLLVLASCVPPNGPGTPHTTVTPATNLTDGQLVRVSATGFTARTSVIVAQCSANPPTPNNCNTDTVQVLTTASNGSVTTQFIVARRVAVGSGSQVDCATANCVLAVSNLSADKFSSVRLGFNRSAPLAPALEFAVRISNTGKVLESQGAVALSGKLICNRAAFLHINGRLSQTIGTSTFRSDFSTAQTCPRGGVFDYGFFVAPPNSSFVRGLARVRFSALGAAGTSAASQAASAHNLLLTALAESSASLGAMQSVAAAHESLPAVAAQGGNHRRPQSATHW